MNTCFALLLMICILKWSPLVRTQSTLGLDGLALCLQNCESSERLVGPTRNMNVRPHPWKIVQFPAKYNSFCKLGCQYFFTEVPKNSTCLRMCDFSYRYQTTPGYSDVAEEAISECRDGCQIALQLCQSGWYCVKGEMRPCPAGTFREPVSSLAADDLSKVSQCEECPTGRYRPLNMGKSAAQCDLCPIGKYTNVTGGIDVKNCLRCPAGKFAEQEGMHLCKCITKESCDLKVRNREGTESFFFKENGDFFRETVPFEGRW